MENRSAGCAEGASSWEGKKEQDGSGDLDNADLSQFPLALFGEEAIGWATGKQCQRVFTKGIERCWVANSTFQTPPHNQCSKTG